MCWKRWLERKSYWLMDLLDAGLSNWWWPSFNQALLARGSNCPWHRMISFTHEKPSYNTDPISPRAGAAWSRFWI
jgi:hypothetical protein